MPLDSIPYLVGSPNCLRRRTLAGPLGLRKQLLLPQPLQPAERPTFAAADIVVGRRKRATIVALVTEKWPFVDEPGAVAGLPRLAALVVVQWLILAAMKSSQQLAADRCWDFLNQKIDLN